MYQFNPEVGSDLKSYLHAVNPWEQDSRSIAIIRNSLILADQMGLKSLTTESHSKTTEMLSQLSTPKFIEIQKEITEKHKTLNQVKLKIASLSQDIQVSEFLQLDIVEKRMNMVNSLCTDLDLVLKNVNMLVNRLQKPVIGDHIKINAADHKFVKEVLTQVVPTLNDLTLHLDNITWASNHDFSSSKLDQLLMEVQSLAASTQTSYHMMSQVRNGLQTLSSSAQTPTDFDDTEESKYSIHNSTFRSPPGGNNTEVG